MGTAPILEMARAYGLRPRLWLLAETKWRKVCPLRRRLLLKIHFADSVVSLMRVATDASNIKIGSSKDLCAKVHTTSGIQISEDNMRSKCVGAVFYS